MSEGLVSRGRELLVVPGTGTVIDLDDPAEVAQALRDVRDLKRQVDEARAVLEAALVAESARQGTKTLRYGSLTASVGPDTELGWDMTVLIGLLDVGLPQARYDELVTETVEYKVNAAVAKQIEAASPVYAKVVEQARVRTPRKQYVKVEGK